MPGSVTASILPRSNAPAPLHVDLTRVGELRDWSIVCGIATAAPTMFSDFTTSQTLTYYDCLMVSLRSGPTGTSLSADVNFGSWGPGNIGLNLWVAVFRGLTPSGSDIPVAVTGPFVVDDA